MTVADLGGRPSGRSSWSQACRARISADPGLALVALAASLVVALYAPTLGRGLVNHGDPWRLEGNFVLQSPSLAALRAIWFATDPTTRFVLGAAYLPVRDLSVLVDFAVWGDAYGGHHLTNLAIYLAAVLLWFATLTRFGVDRRVAGLAILLWAIHPSHAEAVAWLSARSGLLGAALAGAAGLGYARFRTGRGGLALAMVAAALAVWSDTSSAFTLAALAGLELALPARRVSWRRAAAGLAAIAVVVVLASVPAWLIAAHAEVAAAAGGAPPSWVATVVGVHGGYLELAAMAFRNAVAYPIATAGPSPLQLALGVLGLVVVVPLAVVPRRGRWRPPQAARAAAWLWLVGWLPVSGLLAPAHPARLADQGALIPTLGFTLAVALALGRLTRGRARTALIVALIVAAALRTLDAESSWLDGPTLWQRAVASDPADGDAWASYAEALDQAGEPQQAIEVTMTGLRRSRAPRLLHRKALLLLAHGTRSEGVAAMRAAAEGGEPRAMAGLALLLLDGGRPDEALAWARRATLAAPMSDRGHRDLGTVAFAAGRAEEALVAFRQALALAPAPINHFNLARALIVEGQPAAARRHLAACVDDPTIGPLAAAALAALPP